MYAPRIEKAMKTDPAEAQKLIQSQADSNLYKAEAAYWQAVESLMEYREGQTSPATRPASHADKKEGGATAPPSDSTGPRKP
jgi:hypothetical protein